jgi:predicted nucleotidyltransferase
MGATGETGGAGDLPAGVGTFLDAAITILGPTLRSAVLFGSAAEGRLRPTSDVNLILVLRAFEIARMDRLREPLRLAAIGARVAPMFLLESELEAAETAFAVKFMDVAHRRRVLYGDDPFASLAVPRAAAIARLRQVLLNLLLRVRQRYVHSLREDRLALVLADTAGPLRAAAATLLALEGRPPLAPREALAAVAESVEGGSFDATLALLSQARETGAAPPGAARDATIALLDLIPRMLARAAKLGAAP